MNKQEREAMQMALDAVKKQVENNNGWKTPAEGLVINVMTEALAQPTVKESLTAEAVVSDYDREFWGDGQDNPGEAANMLQPSTNSYQNSTELVETPIKLHRAGSFGD